MSVSVIGTFVELDIGIIDPSPFQSRKTFNTADLEQTIKANGFHGAILVRPVGNRYQIVYGERRLRAMKALGNMKMPCIIKEMDDEAAHQMLIVENLQRDDLDPFEEAHALVELKNRYTLSLDKLLERLGKTLGKSRATLAQKLNRVLAPKETRDAYYKYKESGHDYEFRMTHVDLIVRQPVEEDRIALTSYCIAYSAATRSLERHIEQYYRLPLDKVFFDVADDTLGRPACNDCPMRQKTSRAKGVKDARGDKCMAPGCYQFKNEQYVMRLAAQKNMTAVSMKEGSGILDYYGKEIDYSSRLHWVAIDDKCPDDTAHRTYRVLLKDSKVQLYLIPKLSTAALLEGAKRKEAYQYLKKRFDISPGTHANSDLPTSADLARRDEKKAKRLAWLDVAAQVAEKSKGLKPVPREHWPHMYERFRYYEWKKAIDYALGRRKITLPAVGYSHLEPLKDYAATLPSKEQASLYYEIVWLMQAMDWWDRNNEKLKSEAIALVTLLGIKPADYYKKHLAEIRQKKRARIEQQKKADKKKLSNGGRDGKPQTKGVSATGK